MRLPNAPLLEVVFELRWRVENTGDPFGYDPGFGAFTRAFGQVMNASGYKTHERVLPPGPTFAHRIANRYRQQEPFPLMQVGHGIFACNMSTDYEWDSFREIITRGVRNVQTCYPDTTATPLAPCHFELRYVDVFNEELVGSASWQNFITKHTKLKFTSLPYLENITVEGSDNANFELRQNLIDSDLGRFELQIANGLASGRPGILMTSKVVKSDFGEAVPARAGLEGIVLNWADAAHQVTHNFFEAFIDDALMARFKEKKG